MEKKLEYGLFDKEYVYDPEKIRKIVLSEEHRAIAREVARQTIVLLKNEDVLPVREKKRILVIGELADDKEALTGPWAFTGDSGKNGHNCGRAVKKRSGRNGDFLCKRLWGS